jgi:ATP/maltotriose-dependent transcriptional regulator MalT
MAYHAERARAWQLAYAASLAAGDAAMTILGARDALTHYHRAQGLARAGHVATDEAETLALDRRLVAALRGAGRLEEAATAARIMAQRAAASSDHAAEAWAWIQFADARTFAQRFADATAGLERGRIIAETLGDDGLLAAALATRGVMLSARGRLDEAEQDLQQAIPLAERAGNRAIALKGLIYVGFTASWRGQFREAITTCKEAMQLADAAHDASSLADARFSLALALTGCGEYEDALSLLHDLLAFATTSGEPYYAVRAPNTIGWIYCELALVERALAWDERGVTESGQGHWPGHFKARANSLLNLGTDLTLLGRLDEAETALEQAAEAVNQSDYMRWRTANRLALCLGELALARGDGERALLLATEALSRAMPRRAAKYVHLAHDLTGRALAAIGRDTEASPDLEQAVTLAAAIDYRAGHWRSLAHLANTLRRQGRASVASQHDAEAGRVLSAIAERLRDPELRADFLAAPHVAAVLARAGSASSAQPSPYPRGLSGREVEVLRLVAEGLTNSQIAARLFLSPKTVSSHLVSIFGKLEVTSRASATRFAIEHGLV